MRATNGLLRFAIAITIAACRLTGEKGNGHVRAETRSVEPFHAIDIAHGFEADVTVGGAQSVLVTTDDNLLPLVRTFVRDGHLVFEPARPLRPTTLHVTIITPSLDGMSLSGGVRAIVRGVASPNFHVQASGGATLTVSGSTSRLDATLSGGVSLSAGALLAETAALEASGGVRADVMATRSIQGSLSGGVSLRVGGNPPARSVSASGGSSVQYY
jgi:hypothetical protein